MKWKASSTKGESFAFYLYLGRFVDGVAHKSQPEVGISGHGITLPLRNTFAWTVPLSLFLSDLLFLSLSLSLSFLSLPSLCVNLKGEFWEILDDTRLVSPTPNSTNPTTPILPFYKFPFVRRISVTGFQARPLTGEKAATLNGNLITNDELLMIDGTEKNKNTAGCYRTLVFFFVTVLRTHQPRGKTSAFFAPRLLLVFFLFRVCLFPFFFLLLVAKFHRLFKKSKVLQVKRRKPSFGITNELCISMRRAIFSERSVIQ